SSGTAGHVDESVAFGASVDRVASLGIRKHLCGITHHVGVLEPEAVAGGVEDVTIVARHAQRDQALGIQLQLGMRVERLFMMNLEMCLGAAGGTTRLRREMGLFDLGPLR